MKNKKIILLDGNARAGLQALRSFAQANYQIQIFSAKVPSLAGSSKYCSKETLCPSDSSEKFTSWLTKTLKEHNTSPESHILIPITEKYLGLCLKIEKELKKLVTLPFQNFEQFELATNKQSLSKVAKELGLNVPKSFELKDIDKEGIEKFSYPAVLKPVSTKQSEGLEKVLYPMSPEEVLIEKEKGSNYLLQEKIEGEGYGVFTIFKNQSPKALFCHKRLLEKPPSGGVSVLSESVSRNHAPAQESLKLLEKLNWSGLAMLEYKKTKDGKFYLLEINPRFWGSLALSVKAGIDFPRLLIESSEETEPNYKEGIRLRWAFGTLDHFLILLKTQKLKAIYNLFFKNSLSFSLKKKTYLDVFSVSDPVPFLFEKKEWVIGIFKSIFKSKNS